MKHILIFILAAFPLLTYGQSFTKSESQKSGKRDKQLMKMAEKINEFYVFVDVAKRLSEKLKSEITKKTFENLSDQEFADKLSLYLSKNANDRHFNVLYRPNVEDNPTSEKEMLKRFNQINRQWNYGFEKVERLDGNIGYIRHTGFVNTNEPAKRALAASMNFVANTNALILDLRDNNGGSSEMIELFLSYFFEKKVELGEAYTRYNNQTTKSYTKQKVRGTKYLNKPIYILVGKRTVSAAEAVAYNLQARKLATVMGEPTYGAANAVKAFNIDKKFHLFVPVSDSKNPVTKSNWEQSGVIPNMKVKAEKALTNAHILALANLLKSNVELDLTTEEIKQRIAKLRQSDS